MGLLTFSINVTLDGCVDHQEGIADDETHAFFTRLMNEGGAMLWGRITYEMMESYWPLVARGDVDAPPAMREWAVALEAKPKYVVSSTRSDFPWANSHHIAGDLRTAVQALKDATPAGVLLGSGKLATALDRLDLVDEYMFLVHPRIAGHGPTLYQSGLPSTRRLELISANPLRNGAVAMHYRRAGFAGQTPMTKTSGIWSPKSDAAVVRYQVQDVERTIAFYTEHLGFQITQRTGPVAIISRGELHLLLSGPASSGARPMPDGRKQEPGGWNRIVLYVDSIDATIAALTRANARFRNDVEVGPGGKQILVDDPDGNPIELHEAPKK